MTVKLKLTGGLERLEQSTFCLAGTPFMQLLYRLIQRVALV
jgi:hypothetical protein